ncbi:sensor domain-containing diguanylate cyclase [Ruminococcus sp.]|uniref:sensor domain-containing diguanylate cyclase n=1 Tax=Ruminococcus sp. TaxID=41978 RepID=UPI001B0255C6|nr:sensor domain-containing diguanylate cyclase [Ruminococcus sp.]MBO5557156.1 diguanylate cyclase [Ruminococcus sp.]
MKEKNSAQQLQQGGSFFRLMMIYLIVCSIGFTVMMIWVNKLMKEHDKTLTTQICDLVAEKMNNSISYMTSSAENMAAMLTAQELKDFDNVYGQTRFLKGEAYISMGFVDMQKRIYASDSELEEFEKWDLLEIAKQADPVSISPPYRSGLTGQPVFTLFANITYGGNKKGKLFMTYPLKEIQNIAYTETLADETEIWLMNAESDNLIQCAGKDKYAVGSWANAGLTFEKNINESDRDDYLDWKRKMSDGEDGAALVYKSGQTGYTQVFADIPSMHGWKLVVRIPSSAMSSAMMKFRTIVIVFTTLLLLATFIMFVMSHKRDEADKEILENLSIHDPLTEVMNRRAFDMAAQTQLAHIGRDDGVMIFIDIDYFKTVNDKYGHDAGDKVLKEFAALLKDVFGENSLIARYGGDEFLVFQKGADRAEAEEKMVELNRRAHDIRPANCPEDDYYHVSCSCGGAVCPENSRDFEELKSLADSALYDVKERGRDGHGWYAKGSGK